MTRTDEPLVVRQVPGDTSLRLRRERAAADASFSRGDKSAADGFAGVCCSAAPRRKTSSAMTPDELAALAREAWTLLRSRKPGAPKIRF